MFQPNFLGRRLICLTVTISLIALSVPASTSGQGFGMGSLGRGFAGASFARGLSSRSLSGPASRSTATQSTLGRSTTSGFGRSGSGVSSSASLSRSASNSRSTSLNRSFGTKSPPSRPVVSSRPSATVAKPTNSAAANTSATARSPMSRSTSSRPSWRKSETDVQSALSRNQGRVTSPTQKAFANKSQVSPRTAGSVRPDVFQKSGSGRAYAFEVKNYKVTTAAGRSRLVGNVSKQVQKRSRELPSGTRQQVVIDVRGQNISRAEMTALKSRIVDRSGGSLKQGQVSFLVRTPK